MHRNAMLHTQSIIPSLIDKHIREDGHYFPFQRFYLQIIKILLLQVEQHFNVTNRKHSINLILSKPLLIFLLVVFAFKELIKRICMAAIGKEIHDSSPIFNVDFEFLDNLRVNLKKELLIIKKSQLISSIPILLRNNKDSNNSLYSIVLKNIALQLDFNSVEVQELLLTPHLWEEICKSRIQTFEELIEQLVTFTAKEKTQSKKESPEFLHARLTEIKFLIGKTSKTPVIPHHSMQNLFKVTSSAARIHELLGSQHNLFQSPFKNIYKRMDKLFNQVEHSIKLTLTTDPIIIRKQLQREHGFWKALECEETTGKSITEKQQPLMIEYKPSRATP